MRERVAGIGVEGIGDELATKGLFVGAAQRRAARHLIRTLAFGQRAQHLGPHPFHHTVLRGHGAASIAET
jgi:hypothetical protein